MHRQINPQNRSVQETKYRIKQHCLCKDSRLLLWRVLRGVFQGFEKSSHDNILFVMEEAKPCAKHVQWRGKEIDTCSTKGLDKMCTSPSRLTFCYNNITSSSQSWWWKLRWVHQQICKGVGTGQAGSGHWCHQDELCLPWPQGVESVSVAAEVGTQNRS